MSARQRHRQFHFAQGRRGKVSAPGEARPPPRRGGGRDGFRRTRPGGFIRAAHRGLQTRLRFARRESRFPAAGHYFRSQCPDRRHRDGGTRELRRGLHPRNQMDQGKSATGQGQRRHQQCFIFVPRQQRRARGDAQRVSLSRHQGRTRHGHRQRRNARGL